MMYVCIFFILTIHQVYCIDIYEIASKEQMPIKQHYLGPNLKYHHKDNRITIKCEALMKQLNSTDDKNAIVWPPLEHMPDDLRNDFLMDGLSKVFQDYSYLQHNGKIILFHFLICNYILLFIGNTKPYEWDMNTIKHYQDTPNTCGPFYNTPVCAEAMTKHVDKIKDKKGLVIGTMDPWAEAWLLKMGAASVTTLEYHRIESHVPNLYSLHPSEVKAVYDKGELFDFIFSFSSLEHNGLGKWGDPINPYGDLEDYGRCHCLLKDNGYMFLGIPVGRDEVVWNAHRIYGRYRLSLVLKNWKVVDFVGNYGFDNLDSRARWEDQPVILLQKESHTMEH